jgi:hypothetical protein
MNESKVKGLVADNCSIQKCNPTSCDKKILCDQDNEIKKLKQDLETAIQVFQEFNDTYVENQVTKPLYKKEERNVNTAQQQYDKAVNELYEIAENILNQNQKFDDMVKGAKARGAVPVTNLEQAGGYVATTRRVILNGGGQKRVVYKKNGKGDDYVKIGGAFVNLKRNFTKKR